MENLSSKLLKKLKGDIYANISLSRRFSCSWSTHTWGRSCFLTGWKISSLKGFLEYSGILPGCCFYFVRPSASERKQTLPVCRFSGLLPTSHLAIYFIAYENGPWVGCWRSSPAGKQSLSGAVLFPSTNPHLTCQSDKLPEDCAGVGNMIPLALQCKKITTVGLFISTRKMCNITKYANFLLVLNTILLLLQAGVRLIKTHQHIFLNMTGFAHSKIQRQTD